MLRALDNSQRPDLCVANCDRWPLRKERFYRDICYAHIATSSGRTNDMKSPRLLHLGAFMRPASIHTSAWRYPGECLHHNFHFRHLTNGSQALELVTGDVACMTSHHAVPLLPLSSSC